MMKLYYPIWFEDKKYLNCEIKRPTPLVISETEKLVSDSSYGQAMLYFVANCITSYADDTGICVEEKDKIRAITKKMKQKCLEDLAVDIMLKIDNEDGIEGVYYCPRCGDRQIAEKKGDDDTRDFISILEVNYLESDRDYFEVQLAESYKRFDKDELVEDINTLGFHYPSIENFITVLSKFGLNNKAKISYGSLVECLETINGKTVDKIYKDRYGMKMFENLPNIKDLVKISSEMSAYGRSSKISNVIKNGKQKLILPIFSFQVSS
jgi:hypothetical protein